MSAFTKDIDTAGAVRIGVLSDTHGNLPQFVLSAFEERKLDAIIHAGDVGREQILWQLELLAPIIAIRGNCDWAPALQNLTTSVKRQLGTSLLLVTHKPTDLALELRRLKKSELSTPHIIGIHGHTHIPRFEQLEDNIWLLCPGSPVEPRGKSVPSVAILTLAPDSSPEVEFTES